MAASKQDLHSLPVLPRSLIFFLPGGYDPDGPDLRAPWVTKLCPLAVYMTPPDAEPLCWPGKEMERNCQDARCEAEWYQRGTGVTFSPTDGVMIRTGSSHLRDPLLSIVPVGNAGVWQTPTHHCWCCHPASQKEAPCWHWWVPTQDGVKSTGSTCKQHKRGNSWKSQLLEMWWGGNSQRGWRAVGACMYHCCVPFRI